MRGFRVVAGVVLVAALAAGCGAGEVSVPSVPGDAASGAVLFGRSCAGCHGAGGEGAEAGPSLLEARYAPPGFDDLAVVTAIVRGVPAGEGERRGMPRIRGLSEQDLADLLAFVRAVQRDAGPG